MNTTFISDSITEYHTLIEIISNFNIFCTKKKRQTRNTKFYCYRQKKINTIKKRNVQY